MTGSAKTTRREFLTKACELSAAGFVTAFAWGSLSLRDANARWMPRPPGAVDGKDFLALCSRCGQCVTSCPYETLRLAGPFDPAPGGTPIVCQGDISGGQSDKGTAEHNGVRMGSGMVYGSIFGARGSDRASSNHVDVESGTVQGEVTGGEGTSQAVDNTVRLSGGSVQDVTGGRVTDREHVLGHVNQIFGQDPEENEEPQDSPGTQKLASRNQVIISGGSVFGSVTGGISESGSATDNTVVISENATLSDSTVLSGGDAPTTFSGNVLEVSGAIMANSIRNFETIRFASPAMEGGCLILSGKAVLSAKGQTAKIVVSQLASGAKLPESFVLIHAEEGIDLGGGSFTKKQPGVRHGASSVTLLYSLSRDGRDLIATVDTGHGTKK